MMPSMHTATGASSGGAVGGTPTSKIIMFIEGQKSTPFSPSLSERLARMKTLHAQIFKMIDRVRFVAQTNPTFRGERLVASSTGMVSDRALYAAALKDSSLACFDNVAPLAEYTDQIASAMHAIANYQDTYLRQVQIFAVKPLKDFAFVTYPRIMAEYTELQKRRDKYDIARGKKAVNLQQALQDFVMQANLLDASLEQIGEHQMMFAKAVDVVARGECQWFKEIQSVIESVPNPQSRKRWGNK